MTLGHAYLGLAGEGQKVEHAVGRAAKGHEYSNGILKRLATQTTGKIAISAISWQPQTAGARACDRPSDAPLWS